MDNVLRCSIIFMTLHIYCLNFGFASINPITNTNYNKVIRQQNHLESLYSNDDSDLPWLRVREPLTPNFDSYDFEDYNNGGEEMDNSVENSNENTQSAGSDYDADEYEEDESLISADKRSHSVGKITEKHVDLCPIHAKKYKIRNDWRLRGYELRLNYTEHICNHTTTSPGYDRQNNRICYSVGRTFEYGHGTHCFQRYTSEEIEVKSISGKTRNRYTERLRDGCTCGWATYELGPIEDYHFDKILNLCSQLKDKV